MGMQDTVGSLQGRLSRAGDTDEARPPLSRRFHPAGDSGEDDGQADDAGPCVFQGREAAGSARHARRSARQCGHGHGSAHPRRAGQGGTPQAPQKLKK